MIVIDTGVLYAAADSDDTDRDRSARVLTDHTGELLVPTPVVVETSSAASGNLRPSSITFTKLVTARPAWAPTAVVARLVNVIYPGRMSRGDRLAGQQVGVQGRAGGGAAGDCPTRPTLAAH